MKYLCDGCQALVSPATFTVEGVTLTLVCTPCGGRTLATRAASAEAPPALRVVPLRTHGARLAAELARSQDPFEVPPGHCPKCLAPRPDAAVGCAQCGLVFDNFVALEHRPSEPLRAAWLTVLRGWAERENHERFLALALGRGELPTAGRLYRLQLARSPGDAEAERGREEVLRLASASSAFEPTQADDAPGRAKWLIAVFFFVLMCSVAAWALLRA